MDMVAIGSPSGLHAAQGIAAAQRGLHVLTEKPIDISTERADALIEAAERSGVKLGVMFQDRVKPGIRELREWISTGVIGKPLLVDAQVKWYRPPEYYSGSRWRGTSALDGGGALINQAVHTVDLLLWLLGDVVRVQARTATLLHAIETEDTALAILEFVRRRVGDSGGHDRGLSRISAAGGDYGNRGHGDSRTGSHPGGELAKPATCQQRRRRAGREPERLIGGGQ